MAQAEMAHARFDMPSILRLGRIVLASLFVALPAACFAQDPHREYGGDSEYSAIPKGVREHLQAPYGRTPSGSARLFKPFVGIDPNDHDQSYLSYDIPKNAVKKTPFSDRGDRAETIKYSDPATDELVASERILPQSHRRIQLELFKAWELHGVQREWYDDGKPKSESPYKNGVMHGLFKRWDEKGNLVACYKIVSGSGIEKVYYSNGRLMQEVQYRENVRNGLCYQLYDNGQMMSVGTCTNGRPSAGVGIDYYPSGEISDVACHDEKGQPIGPFARFAPDGKLDRDVTYFLDGMTVTKDQYLQHSKADPKLPKVENDPQRYKGMEDDRIKRIVAEYKVTLPVKIPLECDQATVDVH
jgi:antitoxin component YwqK of YwqJK toxin-antitoxin module